MEPKTGMHHEEEHAPGGTRKRTGRRTDDAAEENIPSLVNNPIIHGTQLHDYAYAGAFSSGSSFNISNPTSIYNSSGEGVPVGSSSGIGRGGHIPSGPAHTPIRQRVPRQMQPGGENSFHRYAMVVTALVLFFFSFFYKLIWQG